MTVITTLTLREDFGGIWWPDYCPKPEATFHRLKRHIRDLDHSIGRCERRRTVIQAGGHVGLWPLRLARFFRTVYTFEPEPVLYQCLLRNILGAAPGQPPAAVKIHPVPAALGSMNGEGEMCYHGGAGGAYLLSGIDPDPAPINTFSVKLRTIDSFEFREVDLIVLDIEGSEPRALMGAVDTITRCHPVIHVEELARVGTETRDMLTRFGYTCVANAGADSVWEYAPTRGR